MAFHTKTYEAYGNIRVKLNQPCNYLNRAHKSKVNIFGQYLNDRLLSFAECEQNSFCTFNVNIFLTLFAIYNYNHFLSLSIGLFS